MSALRAWWAGLSARERAIIGFGAGAALIMLVYALVWAPWRDALGRLRQQVPVQHETLAWMRAEAKRIKPLLAKQSGAEREALPLLTIVERTSTSVGLRDAIRQMQPGRNNEVKIWLQETDFDPWVQWLEVLGKRGIGVATATVNRATRANKVNIRMTIVRE